MANPCKYYFSDGSVLSYDEMRAYMLENYDTVSGNEIKEVTVDEIEDAKGDEIVATASKVVDNLVNRSNMPNSMKKAFVNAVNESIKKLTLEQMRKMGQQIIQDLGGHEKALAEATRVGTSIPLGIRSAVLGEVMLYAREKHKTDKSQKWLDMENEAWAELSSVANEAGKFNSYINEIYEASPYVIVKETRDRIDDRNAVLAPNIEKNVQEAKEAFEDTKETEEGLEEALESLGQDLSAANKEIEELKKRLAEVDKEAKATVSPVQRVKERYKTQTKPAIDRIKKKFADRAPGPIALSTLADPELIKDLREVGSYVLESGYVKFSEFYKKMKKELGGAYEEHYADLYNSQKEKAIEDGMKPENFTSEEDVDKEVENLFQEAENLKRKIREKAFQKKMSEAIPKQGPKDKRNRKEKMLAEAKQLDQELGGTTYQDMVETYFETSKKDAALIKEALIEAGFSREVKGKTQVDWAKVTKDAKNPKDTFEKIRGILEGKLPKDEVDRLMPAFEQKAMDIISEKKKAAVTAKVNQITRYKMSRVLNRLKNKNKIGDLVDLWRQGGLTNKAIQEKLGSSFGFTQFTKENEIWIENQIQEIETAQTGGEKELLEEQLHAYLESIGAPLISLNRIMEKAKARLLMRVSTNIKNLTGLIDTATMLGYETLKNNIISLAKDGKGDKQIIKAIYDARREAFATSLDILLNGGVDTGIALSETTNTKEGSPRVRYMENDRRKLFRPIYKQVFGKNVNVNPLNLEKMFSRFMSGIDTVSQIFLQGAGSYSYIKNELLKQNPNMSSAEASKKAYQIAYSLTIAEAEAQAAKEFEERGMILNDIKMGSEAWNRFNKRVDELVQKGDKLTEAVQQARKEFKTEGKPLNQSTGKRDRIRFARRVNEIIAQRRGEGAVAAGQKLGNLYTYKHTDPGIMAVPIYTISGIKSGAMRLGDSLMKEGIKMSKEGNDSVGKSLYLSGQAVKAIIGIPLDQFLFPFVRTVGNIVERKLEFVPWYGASKVLGYGVARIIAGKDMGDVTYDRTAQIAFRAALGLAAIAIFKALADDDEENPELKAIYGEGSPDFEEKKKTAIQRPENTIRIGGHDYSFELFGSLAGPLAYEAAKQDALRYNEGNAMMLGSLVMNLISDTYFESSDKLITAIKSKKEGSLSEYAGGQLLEFASRAMIPYTSTFREMEQVRDPRNKEASTMLEKIAKYTGIIGGWTLDRPAYDYRGKEYNSGDVFTSSSAGMLNVIKKNVPLDDVDRVVFEYAPGITQLSRNDEDLRVLEEGDYVPLDRKEFYEVGKQAAKNFDKLITDYVKKGEHKKPYFESPTDVALGTKDKAARKVMAEKGFLDEAAMWAEYFEMRRRDKIARDIGALNSLAKEKAVFDYLVKNKKFIPFDMRAKFGNPNTQMKLLPLGF